MIELPTKKSNFNSGKFEELQLSRTQQIELKSGLVYVNPDDSEVTIVCAGKNVYISTSTFIGEGCSFGNDITIDGKSIIGEGCTISDDVWIRYGAKIGNDSFVGKKVILGERSAIGAKSFLADRVKIGHSATIKGGERISEGTLVPPARTKRW